MKHIDETAEETLQRLTDWICRHPRYSKCPDITKAIYLGGAVLAQILHLQPYPLRERQVGFDLINRQFKLRFTHRHGGVIELVERDGIRDKCTVSRIASLQDAARIIADLQAT